MSHKFQLIAAENAKSLDFEDILPEGLLNTLKTCPKEYLGLSEGDLIQLAKPTSLEWNMRHRFWMLYDAFCNPEHPEYKRKRIMAVDMYGPLCSYNDYLKIARDPVKVAFVMTPLEDAIKVMELNLAICNKRLQELLQMDVSDKDGRVCPKRAMVLLNTINMYQNRTLGKAVENIRQLHVHASKPNTPSTKTDKFDEYEKPGLLDSKIKELSAELNNSNTDKNPKVIDAVEDDD